MITFVLTPISKKYSYFCFILSWLHVNYPFKKRFILKTRRAKGEKTQLMREHRNSLLSLTALAWIWHAQLLGNRIVSISLLPHPKKLLHSRIPSLAFRLSETWASAVLTGRNLISKFQHCHLPITSKTQFMFSAWNTFMHRMLGFFTAFNADYTV